MRQILQDRKAQRHDLMQVKLLRNTRILHKAGEIVEVSPVEFNFLVGVGSAVEVSVRTPKAETAETVVDFADKVEKKGRPRKR